VNNLPNNLLHRSIIINIKLRVLSTSLRSRSPTTLQFSSLPGFTCGYAPPKWSLVFTGGWLALAGIRALLIPLWIWSIVLFIPYCTLRPHYLWFCRMYYLLYLKNARFIRFLYFDNFIFMCNGITLAGSAFVLQILSWYCTYSGVIPYMSGITLHLGLSIFLDSRQFSS